MEIKLLSCPLCMKPHFEGVDSLRLTLINVATSHLSCPVCDESLLGLDKLTIHLFSHINNDSNASNNTIKNNHNSMRNNISCNQKSIENIPTIVNNNRNDDANVISNEKLVQTVKENKQISVEKSKEQKTKETPSKNNNNKIKCEESDNLRCDLCNFYFSDRTILEMHQKLLHQTIPDQATGICNYHCHLCSKKFKKRGSLMVHLRVAHYSYSHQNNSFYNAGHSSDTSKTQKVKEESNNNAKLAKQVNGQKTNENKQWECDVCSKLFTTKYFLKKHKRLHTGEMPYSCTQCNKFFTFQQSYHKHMLYHSSEKPYVCNECGRAFKELSTLQNHARIHSGERPFVCETCGKRFRQRVSYLVHRRIHTGVMPYKCTACNKSFRYKVSQRSHKCPASPPGIVVKDEQVTSERNSFDACDMNDRSRCTLSVDFSTGDINLMPGTESRLLERSCSTGDLLKESLVLNNNERIQITYNKSDLRSALDHEGSSVRLLGSEGNFHEHDNSSHENIQQIQENGQADLFSMMLSPLLPDVESLCLSNNSPSSASCDNNGENGDEMLSTMNEDSLKELIYGVLDKCERC